MSLAIIGFLTILITLALMLSKKLTPAATLVLVPSLACIIAGQAGELGTYSVAGVKSVSSTVVMFMFAVVFFNSMMDAGAFDPIVNAVIKFAGSDPVKINIATAMLACVSHLDGSGTTTTIITCSAMHPIYSRMRMRPLNMIIIVALCEGVMNILPWGGPTLRAMTAYNATMGEVFNPLIIPMIAGLAAILIIAVVLGKADAKRIKTLKSEEAGENLDTGMKTAADESLKRPKMVGVNLFLIVLAVVTMVAEWLPPCPTMMLAATIGLIINYPNPKMQTKLISKYGSLCLNMATIMFSAGVFSGVLNNSGMLDAMAEALVSVIPTSIGRMTPVIVGVLGVPASMIFTPDAWYYSILPTLTTAVAGAGVEALSVARASLLGQMTLGFPGSPLISSTFLLCGMINMDFPDYQKKWLPYAWGVSLVMLLVALISGCVTL